MNILITGGAGFIGSSLNKQLKLKHNVILVDNFSTGLDDNISPTDNIKIINLSKDSCIEPMDELLKDIDIVYHFAASIGVKLIAEDPNKALKNSTKINDNLFPLFEKHQNKVIFSSTSEVYGETNEDSDGSLETDPLSILPVHTNRGSYACSKLMSEFMLRSYNFPSTIVRFFNIVGPSQNILQGHIMPRFIEQAKAGEDITIYGSGGQVRSFCDIRDAVNMLELLTDDKHNNEIYNIGNSTNECSVLSLSYTIIDELKSNSKKIYIPFDEAVENFDDIKIRFPNTEKISKFYKCKYNLNDIIHNIANS